MIFFSVLLKQMEVEEVITEILKTKQS